LVKIFLEQTDTQNQLLNLMHSAYMYAAQGNNRWQSKSLGCVGYFEVLQILISNNTRLTVPYI